MTTTFTTLADLHAALASPSITLAQVQRLIAGLPVDLAALEECLDASDQLISESGGALATMAGAVQVAALDGHEISDEYATAAAQLLDRAIDLADATVNALAVEAAAARAVALVDAYGEDDPRAFAAILEALELQQPGIVRRKMADFGLTLPTPTHVDAEGRPMFSVDEVAAALGVPPAEVVAEIERLEEQGAVTRSTPVARVQ